MLTPACMIPVIVLLVSGSSALSHNDTPDTACVETETRCGFGCCPYVNATCCDDTRTCCRQGSVCLGRLDICLGLISDQEKNSPALHTERAVKLRDIDNCPVGTTSCYGGCCPLAQAVCCPDRQTCCPAGYVCEKDFCRRKKNISTYFSNFVFQTSPAAGPSYSVEQPVVDPFL